MNNLPVPTECKQHTPQFITEIATDSKDVNSYDLESMHRNFTIQKNKMLKQDKEGILILTFNLIEDRLYQSVYGRQSESGDMTFQKYHLLVDPMFKDVFGYSFRYQSLTMTIKDSDGVIQAIVIRHAQDKDGNQIKWKTYGSKKYMPYKIHADEDFVFLYSGMAELILMELFEFSYIGLQSDSMVKHLTQELRELTKDKVIVVLQDNDESFKSIVAEIETFFVDSYKVITLDFEKMLEKELLKGYDFRDFCNETGNIEIVKEKLREEIEYGFRS
jgi:hypothetical protein